MKPSVKDITGSTTKSRSISPKLNTASNPEEQQLEDAVVYNNAMCIVFVKGETRMTASKHIKDPDKFVLDAKRLGVHVDLSYFTSKTQTK
jgi:hypothetical protein